MNSFHDLLCYLVQVLPPTVLCPRIGRTGRAGKHGTSISLWERRDWRKAGGLVTIMEEAGQVRLDWRKVGDSLSV